MNTISERRIKNNRRRRARQLRRKLIMSFFTLVLVAGFSVCLFGFRAKAQGNDEVIYYKYYKSIEVKSGDSLWSYAKAYNRNEGDSQSYIEEVMNMNHLSDETITAGQYLILPYYSTEFEGEYN